MDLKKYIYGHCISPKKVRVFDAYLGTYVVRELPCGNCLHCRNTHVNEWTTRLYAHSKYCKHVYYITLDYASFDLTSSVARKLAAETAACYHNINSTHKYGMHPLLLQKNHLQDFFKRLRKNTGYSLQYFACGEYGTHANGHGYGRPHFHIILFSNDEVSLNQIGDAWSIDGYRIGRVDFHDLIQNGSFDTLNNTSKYSSKFVFKYVCKYLQKGSFDFENLATIDFHRTYFKSLQTYIANADSLFPEQRFVEDLRTLEYNWNQYVRDYSPFVCCSKRPSIGLQYFTENIERFTKRDFKLFGLPKECTAFPSYYVRKTKEQMCNFVALGSESFAPSSSARVGYILQTLRKINNAYYDSRYFTESVENSRRKAYQKGRVNVSENGVFLGSLPFSDLHMYDINSRTIYQFVGYGYNLWRKYKGIGYSKISFMTISDVLNHVQPIFNSYFDDFLKPMYDSRVLQETELNDYIYNYYGRSPDYYQKFRKDVYELYQQELDTLYKTKLLTQNSKTTL